MARIKEIARPSGEAKKRIRRQWRSRRRKTIDSVAQADQKIEKLLIRRFDRLSSVRRFIILWSSLFVLLFFAAFWQLRALSPYYQKLQPVPGGLYNEGLIGSFTNANPLYATGAADAAVSHLIFSGLFKYDSANRLVGDLASGYNLSPNQTRYIVSLRHNVTWQDGKPFTADDVVFTYQTIQNIESQSPLYSSWQSIKVTKADNFTVNFDLPNALSSFPYSLTNGIVPKHLLDKIPPEQLRSAQFNISSPIGTGPFGWKYIEVTGTDSSNRQQRISLAPFKHYWSGRPKIDGLSLITYADDQQLISAFEKKQLNAVSSLDTVPAELSRDKSIHIYSTPLTTAVMAFFNTSHPELNDVNVRRALVSAINTTQMAKTFPYPVELVDEPLLKGQLGYDPTQTQLPYNQAYAMQLLDQAGWKADASGQRVKDGQALSFRLVTSQNIGQYAMAASFLQKAWSAIGVKVVIIYPPSGDDLQSAIANHDYDCLLYGINIGVDPDVFAFWDGSQSSVTSQGHLNLSEYKSAAADQALEAGRTRADPNIRAIKYKAFLSTWSQDAPALGLYQPNFLYLTRGPVFNYDPIALNSTTDRFYSVDNWMIRQQKQTLK